MKAKTIRDVAAIARDRRADLKLSQSQLAAKAGVGRDWVVQFEKGNPTAEWGLVMRVLRELGISIDLQVGDAGPMETADDLDQILSSARKERRVP